MHLLVNTGPQQVFFPLEFFVFKALLHGKFSFFLPPAETNPLGCTAGLQLFTFVAFLFFHLSCNWLSVSMELVECEIYRHLGFRNFRPELLNLDSFHRVKYVEEICRNLKSYSLKEKRKACSLFMWTLHCVDKLVEEGPTHG